MIQRERYAVRGKKREIEKRMKYYTQKERNAENDRESERLFFKKKYLSTSHIKMTHKGLPSVSYAKVNYL